VGKKFQIVWLTWVIRAVGVRIIQAVLYQRPIDVGCIQVSDDLVGVMVFFNHDDDVTRCTFCFVCIACSAFVASNRVIAFWLRRPAERSTPVPWRMRKVSLPGPPTDTSLPRPPNA